MLKKTQLKIKNKLSNPCALAKTQIKTMKKLYLIRHAAAEFNASISDFERPITDEGREEARLLANRIAKAKISVEVVLCSSALRTMQTLEVIEPKLEMKYPAVYAKEIYTDGFEGLRILIMNLNEDLKSAMIIGHNPGISHIARYLLQGSEPSDQNFTFRNAEMLMLDLQIKCWRDIKEYCGIKVEF